VPNRKSMRRKALLAIAFAGGLFNSQLPALPQTKVDSTASVIQKIGNDTELQLEPEDRAYYLLLIARSYLAGDSRDAVEAQFRTVVNQSRTGYAFRLGRSKWRDPMLTDWSDRIALEEYSMHHGINGLTQDKSNAKPIDHENLLLADTAIKQALSQLEKASDKLARLNMYFIASRLFQKSADTAGTLKCDAVLEEAFRSCEESSPVDEKRISAAVSVLNSMAYGVIPIHIPDWKNPLDRQTEAKPFSEVDFQTSDKLKRRAVAIADQLPPTAHVRRKAHRDLALWYLELGRNEMADKEKQILFKLVGTQDDSILYPQAQGCGQFMWWQTSKVRGVFGCGMG
jgi:hypothetical protein